MSCDDSCSAIRNECRRPQLPIEIRLQIWEEAVAVEQPRVVEIWFRTNGDGVDEGVLDRYPPSRATALLYTCRETREIALMKYELYFGSFPFNPSIDTLYLSKDMWNQTNNSFLSRLRLENRSDEIQSMATDLESWTGSSELLRKMISDLRHFTNLQRLIFVVSEDTTENVRYWSVCLKTLRSLQAVQNFRLRKWQQNYGPSQLLSIHRYPKTYELALKMPHGLRFYDTEKYCFAHRGISNDNEVWDLEMDECHFCGIYCRLNSKGWPRLAPKKKDISTGQRKGKELGKEKMEDRSIDNAT